MQMTFEGLGTQPGYMALSLLLVADLDGSKLHRGRSSLARSVFSYQCTAAHFGFLGLQGRLRGNFKLHHFGGGVPNSLETLPRPGGIMSEINTEGSITMVNDFPVMRSVELHSFNVGMEVTPSKHFQIFPVFTIGLL